jgi:hypothetical protein
VEKEQKESGQQEEKAGQEQRAGQKQRKTVSYSTPLSPP